MREDWSPLETLNQNWRLNLNWFRQHPVNFRSMLLDPLIDCPARIAYGKHLSLYTFSGPTGNHMDLPINVEPIPTPDAHLVCSIEVI